MRKHCHHLLAKPHICSVSTPLPSTLMRPLSAILGLVLLGASCRDPRAEANIAEAMMQVGTEMSALRQDYAVLQSQVDSLRGVVARQDSLLARLASGANIPLPAK